MSGREKSWKNCNGAIHKEGVIWIKCPVKAPYVLDVSLGPKQWSANSNIGETHLGPKPGNSDSVGPSESAFLKAPGMILTCMVKLW